VLVSTKSAVTGFPCGIFPKSTVVTSHFREDAISFDSCACADFEKPAKRIKQKAITYKDFIMVNIYVSIYDKITFFNAKCCKITVKIY